MNKGAESYFMEKKEDVGRVVVFESSLEKGKSWGDDSFSLVEWLGSSTSCRRGNVCIFLLGPVIDFL